MNLSSLEKTIGYKFNNKDLLKEALTHRSYLNENASWSLPHNERLEFLGDAVLELTVTEELYHRLPDRSEGILTPIRAALVNYQALLEIADEIKLEKHLLLSKGEAKGGDRSKEAILANATESVIGAIYLDSDYATTKKFINQFIMARLDNVMRGESYRDPKSLLQEKIQSSQRLTPTYKVLEENGPEHHKVFKVAVYFNRKKIAAGEGHSKQEAETEAAKKALEDLSESK
ncbi:TPA: ribonuclease III [Patescibacteria group bacterium]|nr:ribonuclease III [Patescibacteria group bacterium]|tara:strand:+ start:2942 stop:3634 length:693 start_codon:yes stop_codon:yes gene_type:complete